MQFIGFRGNYLKGAYCLKKIKKNSSFGLIKYRTVITLVMAHNNKILTRPCDPGSIECDNINNDLIISVNDIIYDGVSRYLIVSLLGKGTFGQVANCIDMQTGKGLAIKIAKSSRGYSDACKFEADLLRSLNSAECRHVVKFYKSFIHKQHFCIAMELLGPNLFEVLKNRKFSGFSHSYLKKTLKSVLHGLADLHSSNIVHCDIKPENILLENGSKDIKIIDFGSSFYFRKTDYFYVQSRYYRAPEVLLQNHFYSPIDIWSFGCLAFELLLGFPLFPGRSNDDQLARIVFFFKDGNLFAESGSGGMSRSAAETPPVTCKKNDTQSNGTMDKDKFIDIESAESLILTSSNDLENNRQFADLIKYVLKFRDVERPTALNILDHPYLSDQNDHEIAVESKPVGYSDSRDHLNPPPLENRQFRRFTSNNIKDFGFAARKKSEFPK